MKSIKLVVIYIMAFFFLSCTELAKKEVGYEVQSIFLKGELGPADNSTENAWHTALVENDSIYNTTTGNVYFDPGTRSHWHTHPPDRY